MVPTTITRSQYESWADDRRQAAISAASARASGLSSARASRDAEASRIASVFLTQMERTRPTRRRLFVARKLPRSLATGDTVWLPLVAVSADEDWARQFTNADNDQTLVRLAPGLHALHYAGDGYVTAGAFVAARVETSLDPFWKTKMRVVTLKAARPQLHAQLALPMRAR